MKCPVGSKSSIPDVTTRTSRETVETLLSFTVTQPLTGGEEEAVK